MSECVDLSRFASSETGTVGVEMELMILDPLSRDLFPASAELLRVLDELHHRKKSSWTHMPEGKKSMIEVATSVQRSYSEALDEVLQMRDFLLEASRRVGVSLSGGGAHPFAQWSDQRLFDAERYIGNYAKYGYLAKMFTVFGLHVHLGVRGADNAVRACRFLSVKSPVFSALCANSPFWQGEDSMFCSSRNNVVSQFPLSGVIPPSCVDASSFARLVDEHVELGVARTLKDFYWDVRPKPEYGTVEIRNADMPMRLQDSLVLAFYAKALLLEREALGFPDVTEREFLLHPWNRFKANRDGLSALLVRPDGSEISAREIILSDCARLLASPSTRSAIEPIAERLVDMSRDDVPASLRETYRRESSLSALVAAASSFLRS